MTKILTTVSARFEYAGGILYEGHNHLLDPALAGLVMATGAGREADLEALAALSDTVAGGEDTPAPVDTDTIEGAAADTVDGGEDTLAPVDTDTIEGAAADTVDGGEDTLAPVDMDMLQGAAADTVEGEGAPV